jgi:hypothetical protein
MEGVDTGTFADRFGPVVCQCEEFGVHCCMKLSSFAWTLVFAVLIVRLTTIYFEIFQGAGPPTLDVDMWLEGNTPRPFGTRVLVPWVVLGASRVVPEATRQRIEAGTLRLPIRALPARVEYQVLGVLVILCFAGYTVVMRKLVRSVFEAGGLQVNLITGCSLLLMPVMFRYHNYFYDPATLVLSTLLWYLMYRERWTMFLPVFILACFNKETALLFLVSAALWWNHRAGVRPGLPHLAILLSAGLLVRIGIAVLSSHLPGSLLEFHLFDHNLSRLFMFFEPIDLVSTLFIGFLVFSYWKEKPALLTIGTIHLAILVAAAVFSAYVDEYRQYFDCYPILVLTMAYSLMKLGGGPIVPAPACGSPLRDAGPGGCFRT